MRASPLDRLICGLRPAGLPVVALVAALGLDVSNAAAQQQPAARITEKGHQGTNDSVGLPAPIPQVAAVVPGLFAHGLGAQLDGNREASRRLYWAQGGAFGLFLVGAATVVASGASQYVVGPGALLTAFGVTGFATSWLGGLYSTLAPAEGFGQAVASLPVVEARTGYMLVRDAQFDHRHFVANSVHAYVDGWHLGAAGDVAPGLDNQRWGGVVGRRLWGVVDSVVQADGSYLELRLAHWQHRFGREGFTAGTTEVAAEGRLDLHRYLPEVRGAFVQSEAGYGRYRVGFDGLGAEAQTDTSLLLMHMGFGMYFGNRASDSLGGEVELYYDHRHDGFASGLKVRGVGSGALGHFGARAQFRASPRWGIATTVEGGAAWAWTTSLIVRSGASVSPGGS